VARQSFFTETSASKLSRQFELIFDYVSRATSTQADRAELLQAIRAPRPSQASTGSKATAKHEQLQLDLPAPGMVPNDGKHEEIRTTIAEAAAIEPNGQLIEHESEKISAHSDPIAERKPRAKETQPRRRIPKLIMAVGTREREERAIVSKEEWDAQSKIMHTTPPRAPVPQEVYRPSVAKDKTEKPKVSLSTGVGAIFDLEVWGSLSDIDNMGIDPLPSHKECKGIMKDGQFGCVNPKLPGKPYCKEHHSLYCTTSIAKRDMLDAAARQKTDQMVSYEEMKAARNKVRRAGTNAGKGAEVKARMLAVARETRFSMVAAE